jgi:hypothetical protein
VSGLVNTYERPFTGVRAFAVAGLHGEPGQIAEALGLDPAQFAPTRHGAIQADLDVPAGFWRVWPDEGIGLWIGREPGTEPPLRQWRPRVRLDLLKVVMRLGERGIWLYEGQLHGDDGWTPRQPLKMIYEQLQRHPDAFDALSGEFGDSSGRSQQAVISRFGSLETLSPTQAVRWLSIAYDLTRD